MSRAYEMSVSLWDFNPDKKTEIVKAWSDAWCPNLLLHSDEEVETHPIASEGLHIVATQGQLYGGETEHEFAERAAKAIWEANGGGCDLEISSVYLDDPPTETFYFEKDEYSLLSQGNSKNQTENEED